MANEEHLKILKQGVEAWNEWREKNSQITPDLSKANLYKANLTGANLYKADLSKANLVNANLSGAKLIQANLVQAKLHKAKLSGANLSDANLSKAKLSHAQLNGTTLFRTNFSRANPAYANLESSRIYETIFGNTNLTGTEGLDKCNHKGPSTIDHRTLAQSDDIPINFLRGCGLPDFIIENTTVLRGAPIHFYSCFISYSSKDEDFAQRLHADLQNNGVRCWFAPKDIRGGKKLYPQINEAIRLHDKLLLILSEHSMNSTWVATEIRNARKQERREERQMLFPVRIVNFEAIRDWALFDADDSRDLSAEIREYFIPDFSNWKNPDDYSLACERLLRDLKTEKVLDN